MSPIHRQVFALAAVFAACALTSPAAAHHGFAGEFDAAAPVTLAGEITRVDSVNPHVMIHLKVAREGKTDQDWVVITGTPNTTLRRGLCRDALKPGTRVTIRAYQDRAKACVPARGAPNDAVEPVACKAGGDQLIFANGETVDLGYRPGDVFNTTPPGPTPVLRAICEASAPKS